MVRKPAQNTFAILLRRAYAISYNAHQCLASLLPELLTITPDETLKQQDRQ